MNPHSATTGGVAAAGICALAVATVIAGPPVSERPSPVPVIREVTLTAAAVPPGGLLASLLINQVRYCAIICPLVVDTAVTAGVTTLGVPATFLTALQSGDLLRAIGAAAASVTGPTNEVAQAAILADGSRVAPRALNALETAVVGLLDVLPATADGIPGVVRALQSAREDTFAALNAPIVSDPAPTVHPTGVLQVAAVEALNIVGAVIFPAFNQVLAAVFDVPDAVAEELADSGNLGRAVGAGVRTTAGQLRTAVTVVATAVVTGVRKVATALHETRRDRARDDAMPDATDVRNARPAAPELRRASRTPHAPIRERSTTGRARHDAAGPARAERHAAQPRSRRAVDRTSTR